MCVLQFDNNSESRILLLIWLMLIKYLKEA